MEIKKLETARLMLNPLSSEDAEQIQRIFPRWEIVRYLVDSIPWPYPEGAAQHYVDNIALVASREGRGWYWTLRRKAAPDELIGVICLMDAPENNRGFWLVPEWQGYGFMTEACNAATDFWFNDLKRESLFTQKAAINVRSKTISERSGMHLVRIQKGFYVSGELDTEIWVITRGEWNRHHG